MNTTQYPQHMRRRHWALGPVLLLACALLWAQALGLAHRVVHGPQLGGLAATSQTVSQTVTAGGEGAEDKQREARAGQSLWAQLLAAHQSESDCRVFEQLGHADALPTLPLLALPALAPLPPLVAAVVRWLPAPSLPFQARGPPPTR